MRKTKITKGKPQARSAPTTRSNPKISVEKLGEGNYTVKVENIEIPGVEGPDFTGGREGGVIGRSVDGKVTAQGQVGWEATLTEEDYRILFEEADAKFAAASEQKGADSI